MDIIPNKSNFKQGYNTARANTNSNLAFEHNQKLNQNLKPVTLAYKDIRGNIIQIWSRNVTIIASVRNIHGKLSFVTEHNIHNGLNIKETGTALLNRITSKEAQPKQWHLAYSQGSIHVWPYMKAEATQAELDAKYPAVSGENEHKGWRMVSNFPIAEDVISQLYGIPHESIRIDTLEFSSGKLTSHGGKRSSKRFWKAWALKRPETLCSQQMLDDLKCQGIQLDQLKPVVVEKLHTEGKISENLKNALTGTSPVINELWIQYFPEHRLFKGDTMAHHHVNFGRYAIPVPRETHRGQETFWHRLPWQRFLDKYPHLAKQYGSLGKFLGSFISKPIDKDVFKQVVQANGLTGSYNISNLTKPMAAARSGAKPTGGVEQKVGIIQGLFDNYNSMKEYEHAFYIPSKDGTQPFTDAELRQILQELASGIYYHDTVPFFSLHFNTDSNMYPVIHPAYKNTLVGKVISMLDYYMKGFLNGAFFDEGFVHEWQVSRTQDKGLLKEYLIDVHEYCLEHLGADTQYFSIRELIDHFEILEAVKEASQGDTDTPKGTLLSDYSGFRSSFRIIAHQNKIQKSEHLFMLDGDFGVEYTIEPDTAYAEELTKYRNRFGHDPKGYRVLEKSYQAMARQIRSLMPKLPKFQELFEMLKVINFFCYYYKTLKQANRIPVLAPVQPVPASCPSLFPHLPIRKMVQQDVKIDLYAAVTSLPESSVSMLETFLKKETVSKKDIPNALIESLATTLRDTIVQKATQTLSKVQQSVSTYEKMARTILLQMHSHTVKEGQKIKSNLAENITNQKALNIRKAQDIESLKNGATNKALFLELIELRRNDLITQINANLAVLQEALTEETQIIAAVPAVIAHMQGEVNKGVAEIAKLRGLVANRDDVIRQVDAELYKLGMNRATVLAHDITYLILYNKPEIFKQAQMHQTQAVNDINLQIQNLERQKQECQNDKHQFITQHIPSMEAQVQAITQRIAQKQAVVNELRAKNPITNRIIYQLQQIIAQIQRKQVVTISCIPVNSIGIQGALKEGLRQLDVLIKNTQVSIQNQEKKLSENDVQVVDIREQMQATELSIHALREEKAQFETLLAQPTKRIEGLLYTHTLANQIVQLYTEQPEAESVQNRRIVGGCGLSIGTQKLVVAPGAPGILDQCFPALMQAEANSFNAVVSDTVEGTAQGHVFKLQTADFVATNNKEHALWLLAHTVATTQDTHSTETAAVFEALMLKNLNSFRAASAQPNIDWHACDMHGLSFWHHASTLSTLVVAQLLLEKGAPINSSDSLGYTPLHYAVRSGTVAMVQFILDHGGNVHQSAHDGCTPLYSAVLHDRLEMVQTVAARGAPINVQNNHGMTPLMCAIHNGHEAIAEYLLTIDTLDIHMATEEGSTPLHLAVETKSTAIVRRLLERGADINRRRLDSYTPVHLAIKEHNPFIVELFMAQADFKVNSELKSGRTLLHLAAEYCQYSLVVALLEKGADVLKTGWDKETALLTALRSGNILNAACIMEHAAKLEQSDIVSKNDAGLRLIDCPDIKGETPLQLALNRRLHGILEDLIDQGAILPEPEIFIEQLCRSHVSDQYIHNMIQKYTISPAYFPKLHLLAAQVGHPHMLSLMQFRYKVDVSLKDEKGRTAHHYYAQYNYFDLLSDFIAQPNVDLLQPDASGKTLAAIAAEHGSARALKVLMNAMDTQKLSIDTQAQGNHLLLPAIQGGHIEAADVILHRILNSNVRLNALGQTAAHIAVRNNDLGMIEFLIKRGVRFNIADINGNTAYHTAIEYKLHKVLDYLLDKKHGWDAPEGLLHYAASKGSGKILEHLLKAGCTVDFNEEHIIFEAITANNMDCFKLLLSMGRIHEARTQGGLTPLMLAARLGIVSMSHALIFAGVDPLAVDTAGYTALKHAVSKDQSACAEYLVHLGAYKNVDITALGIQAHRKHPDHLMVLISNKDNKAVERLKNDFIVSIKEQDRSSFKTLLKQFPLNTSINFEYEGRTYTVPVLHMMYIAYKHSIEKNELLHEFVKTPGVNLNITDTNGQTLAHTVIANRESIKSLNLQNLLADRSKVTPLHMAAANGMLEEVGWMLDHFKSININVEDENGNTPLFYAIQASHGQVIELLLSKGAAVNHYNHVRSTPLIRSIQIGTVSNIELLLKQGANPNQICLEDKQTPIHVAVRNDSIEAIRLLLNYGASVDKPNIDGMLPMHLTAEIGTIAMMRLLLANSASLKKADNKGDTVAHYAARSTKLEMIHLLESYGVAFDTPRRTPTKAMEVPKKGLTQAVTPSHLAALKGDLESIYYLHTRGIDLSAEDENKSNISYYAALNGNKDVLEFLDDLHLIQSDKQQMDAIQAAIQKDNVKLLKKLYSKGRSIEKTFDNNGRTALHIAAICGSVHSAHYMIHELGANIHHKSWNNYGILDLAIINHKPEFVAYILNEHLTTVSLDQNTGDNKKLLHLACELGNKDIAAILVEKGASVNILDMRGSTPLDYAIQQKKPELIQLLKHCGGIESSSITPQMLSERSVGSTAFIHKAILDNNTSDLPLLIELESADATNVHGDTPVHSAVLRNDLSSIRILLQNNADLEIRNQKGETPLSTAVTVVKNRAVIEFLIKAGAQTDIVDLEGNTLLHKAVLSDNVEGVEYLLQNKADLEANNIKGETPLFTAVLNIKDIKVINLLLEAGAKTQVDIEGKSLLDIVIEKGFELIVEVLIRNHIKPNKSHLELAYNSDQLDVFKQLQNYFKTMTTESSGASMTDTQLKELKSNEELSFIFDLLMQGFDPFKYNSFTEGTLLHASIKAETLAITQFLIWLGLPLEVTDESGNTPLYLAAVSNDIIATYKLLKAGANLNTINGKVSFASEELSKKMSQQVADYIINTPWRQMSSTYEVLSDAIRLISRSYL